MINIAIMGFGTIGSGVARLIESCRERMKKLICQDVNVKYVLDMRDFPGTPYENKTVHDVSVIVNDPEVQIVCETMGGTGAAFDFSMRCLKAGKSVVSSNKAVVAAYGDTLTRTAKENGVRYLYEASVGGGIPVIRTIDTAFAGCRVESIDGILNGTTNYILTEMIKSGKTLESALKEAQAKGYAEANPEADVEGADACRKICILSAMAFGKMPQTEQVGCSGIMGITLADTETAAKFGASVKLVASARLLKNGKYDIRVSPCLVREQSPLSKVDGVYNAINIKAELVEDTTLIGQGAGSYPTAGAVLSDIMEILKTPNAPQNVIEMAQPCDLCDTESTPASFYAAIKGGRDAVANNFPDAEILYEGEGICAFVCPDIAKQTFDFLLEAGKYEVISKLRVI